MLFPETLPFDQGMLDVRDGHRVHWQVHGNPSGKAAVAVHGGPGSGCGPGWAQYFDPGRWRVVLFDQRGCGRSTPSAAEPDADLSANTTHHLVADMELLRQHLGIGAWLVFGGSWGATLGQAYAQRHPSRVSELVLFSVTCTSRREVEWITRDMGRIFPAEWARFVAGVPEADRDGNLAAAYSRLLHSPDPAVRDQAARDWCAWEDVHVATGEEDPGPDPRFADPVFRLLFARLVTRYFAHTAWLQDGELLRGAHRLHGIPGLLVHGKRDISSPPDIAWNLAQAWPDAELVLVPGATHGAGHDAVRKALLEGIARVA